MAAQPANLHYRSWISNCLLMLSLAAGLWLSASAQQYGYVHYDTKDGLAGSTVHGIAQDKDGFMWFCTETGLSRFDGTSFKTFTRADGLPSNEVFGAFVDSKNRIWITSFKNAICYYYKGRIHNQQNDSALKKIHLGAIATSVAENPEGDILISCNSVNNFFVLKQDGNVSRLARGARFDIAFGQADFPLYIVAIPDSVRKVLSDSCTFIPPALQNDRAPGERTFLLKRPNIAYYNGGRGWKFTSFPLKPFNRYVACLDDTTIVTMGTHQGGIQFYDPRKKQVVATFLPDNVPHFALRDREGCLWFSTDKAGVYKLSNPTFKHIEFMYRHMPLAVLSIQRMKDGLYAGTDNEQYWRLMPTGSGTGDDQWYRAVNVRGSVAHLAKRIDNQVINYSGSNFLHLGLQQQFIKTIYEFNDTLLLGSAYGATLVHLPTLKRMRTLYQGRVTAAFKNGSTYYIGTLNGLYALNADGSMVFLGDSIPLFRNRISHFAAGADGTLWVATYEAGIIGYRNGKVITNITRQNGALSSDICRCISADGNVLWVGTEKGLNKVDIRPGRYRSMATFTSADGLGSDLINCIYTEGRKVYVGTPAGLTYFDQDKAPKRSVCEIHLTDVIVSGRKLDPDQEKTELSQHDNNIRFEFAGLSFLSAGDIRYRYRLLGLNDSWQLIAEKFLSYPTLPSGSYTLELQAINKFNNYSPTLRYAFSVRKSLWEKSWFIAMMAMLGMIVVLVASQWRIRQVSKRENEKRNMNQKIAELEHMALRAQMNPHFIFNCLNSIQHYIIMQDVRGANFYLSQFAGLVRKTLENSSRLYVPLSEEIAYLTNYIELERLQLANRFDYSIHTELAGKENSMIPNMVIQPYVENAIKHGVGPMNEGGYVSLEFRLLHDHLLECVIEDNGAGIARTKEKQQQKPHDSKGMSITAGRIEILNQLYPSGQPISVELSDADPVEGKGTRVVLRFPIDPKNNK